MADLPHLGLVLPDAGTRVGIDLQPVADVLHSLERHGQRYLERTYTEGERRAAGWPDAPLPVVAERLAARFAAKEAVFKALGVPSDELPGYLEVEVVSEEGHPPSLRLHGRAASLVETFQVKGLSLSTSHGGGLSVAIVVATWS